MNIFLDQRTQPFIWFVYAVVITTALCGIIYVCVQQSFRQNLDDPQVQMAEDAAQALAGGAVPASVVPRGGLINTAQSLSPWIAVYDNTGLPLESSAQLDGAPPKPPKGLFDDTTWLDHKSYDTPWGRETRVTWQSESGTREALVMVHVGDKFVVAGRNMREIESRIGDVGGKVFLAWAVTIGALFVWSVFLWFVRRE